MDAYASAAILLFISSTSFLPAQVLEGGTVTLGESSGDGTIIYGGTLSLPSGGSFSLSSLNSSLPPNELLSGYSLLVDTDNSLAPLYLDQSLTLDTGSTLQLNIDTANLEASTLNVQGDLSFGNSTLVLDDVAATPSAVALGSTFTLLTTPAQRRENSTSTELRLPMAEVSFSAQTPSRSITRRVILT